MPPKPRSPTSGPARPRFTHFLAFPLRSRDDPASNFTSNAENFRRKLIDAQPAIEGIHESIVVNPIRMHLTIGLMTLARDPRPRAEQSDAGTARSSISPRSSNGSEELKEFKTISHALQTFESCRSLVEDIIRKSKKKRLDVSFDRLDTFQTKLKKCQVSLLTLEELVRQEVNETHPTSPEGPICRAHVGSELPL